MELLQKPTATAGQVVKDFEHIVRRIPTLSCHTAMTIMMTGL